MNKTIFKKFPGLHSEMIAESFARYIKEFRKPCVKKQREAIKVHNKKSPYLEIKLVNKQMTAAVATMKQVSDRNNEKLKRRNSRTKIFEKQEELRQYKEKLDQLNDKANTMFNSMKDINRIVNKKIMDIESAVTDSEHNFVKEINALIKNKGDL